MSVTKTIQNNEIKKNNQQFLKCSLIPHDALRVA